MPKPEWGVKRVCPTTGKRFYDLNRTPVVSPYTGEVIDIDNTRRKSVISHSSTVAKEKKPLVEEIDTDDDLLEADSTDDTELDDDLLEDDEDDTVSLDDLADVPEEDE